MENVKKPAVNDPVCRIRKCNVCGEEFEATQYIFSCKKCAAKKIGRYQSKKNSNKVTRKGFDWQSEKKDQS